MGLIVLVLSSALGWSADANLVKAFPNPVLRNEIVEFKPVKEHHFSLEAPQRCGSGQLIERTARAVKCQFTQSGEVIPLVNVCDDKKTFCKPVELKLKVGQANSGVAEVLIKNQMRNQALKKDLVPGFVEGPPPALMEQALKLGKPVLVMVSTDWCPPCNEAKEHLFRTPTFKNLTKDWFKVYVDGDKLGSADWKKVVPYSFYPTLVLLNPKFQEVARFSGEIRSAVFENWALQGIKHLNDPISSLQKRVREQLQGGLIARVRGFLSGMDSEKLHQERVRLLRWALVRNDRETIDLLTQGRDFPELATDLVRYRLSQIVDDPQKKIELERQLVELTFQGDDWAEALASFCQSSQESCKPYLAKVLERQNILNNRDQLSSSEKVFMLAEESYFLSMIFETVGDKRAQQEWAKACVEQMQSLDPVLQKTRSVVQMLVPCLERAGKFSQAENHLKALIQSYPNEPTFLIRLARAKKKQKKFSEALAALEKAEGLAFGFNWLSTQVLKAEVLLEMKRKPDASRVIASAIAEIALDESRDSTSQTYLARLRSMQEKSAE